MTFGGPNQAYSVPDRAGTIPATEENHRCLDIEALATNADWISCKLSHTWSVSGLIRSPVVEQTPPNSLYLSRISLGQLDTNMMSSMRPR